MSNWLVYPSDVTVELDEATRTGKMPFSIVNKSRTSARVVVSIDPGDDRVKESWFTVENPPKLVRAGATVPFGIQIVVPPTVPAGTYKFAALISPANDDSPEESSVTSKMVDFVVPPPPPPPRKPFPWWIVIAAALLVLVLGVVTWLLWPSSEQPAAAPSPSPSPSATAAPVEYAVMPAVTNQTAADAQKKITDAGLVVGAVNYRFGGGQGVARQSVPAGATVVKGTKVDLEVVATITAPVLTAPGNNASLPAWPAAISWNQPEAHVRRWLVQLQAESCTNTNVCGYAPLTANYVVSEKKLAITSPKFDFTVKATGVRHTGWVIATVMILDDFGFLHPQSATIKFFVEH